MLLFASFRDRKVELVAHANIHEIVGEKPWNEAIEAVTEAMRKGKPADGFVQAIEICGAALAKHFPPDGAPKNRLPNTILETSSFRQINLRGQMRGTSMKMLKLAIPALCSLAVPAVGQNAPETGHDAGRAAGSRRWTPSSRQARGRGRVAGGFWFRRRAGVEKRLALFLGRARQCHPRPGPDGQCGGGAEHPAD